MAPDPEISHSMGTVATLGLNAEERFLLEHKERIILERSYRLQ